MTPVSNLAAGPSRGVSSTGVAAAKPSAALARAIFFLLQISSAHAHIEFLHFVNRIASGEPLIWSPGCPPCSASASAGLKSFLCWREFRGSHTRSHSLNTRASGKLRPSGVQLVGGRPRPHALVGHNLHAYSEFRTSTSTIDAQPPPQSTKKYSFLACDRSRRLCAFGDGISAHKRILGFYPRRWRESRMRPHKISPGGCSTRSSKVFRRDHDTTRHTYASGQRRRPHRHARTHSAPCSAMQCSGVCHHPRLRHGRASAPGLSGQRGLCTYLDRACVSLCGRPHLLAAR